MCLSSLRRGLSCAAIVSLLLAVSACSTVPNNSSQASSSIAEKLSESLGAADKAQKLGKTEEALVALDIAVKVDPASKAPWLRKAQIYFDGRQYGQAITAAQEVLQRDTTDLTAKSVLAVSGLRVSAQALEQLRQANEVNGSAREEAESVAKLIREALGEPILVPTAVIAPASAPTRRSSRAARSLRSAQASQLTSPPNTAPKSTSASTASAAPAAGGRANPFGALQ